MKEQKQAAASLEVSCRLCHEDLLCRDAGQGQTQKEMLQKFEDLHKRRMEARQKYSELEEMLAVKMTQATLRFESARLKSRLASVQLSRRSVLQRLQRVNWEVDEVAFAAVSTFKKIVTENLRNVTLSLNDNTNDKANELKSLQSLHRRVGGEEEVLRKRYLSDILGCVQNLQQVPPFRAVKHGQLTVESIIEECKHDTKGGKSLSDSLGIAIHFVNTMAGVLQLPMSHFGRFRGSNSEIWQQEDFWNIAMPKDPCCLFLQCTSPNKTGEYSRASLAKGIDVFLRSLVIASQGNMHPIAVSELLASPVKYVTYILSLLIHDETSFVSSSELVPEDETGDDDWEIMCALQS